VGGGDGVTKRQCGRGSPAPTGLTQPMTLQDADRRHPQDTILTVHLHPTVTVGSFCVFSPIQVGPTCTSDLIALRSSCARRGAAGRRRARISTRRRGRPARSMPHGPWRCLARSSPALAMGPLRPELPVPPPMASPSAPPAPAREDAAVDTKCWPCPLATSHTHGHRSTSEGDKAGSTKSCRRLTPRSQCSCVLACY
jgi:hypothetical protein